LLSEMADFVRECQQLEKEGKITLPPMPE
jgi:hypothetical protein